jgi:hypothetical protein
MGCIPSKTIKQEMSYSTTSTNDSINQESSRIKFEKYFEGFIQDQCSTSSTSFVTLSTLYLAFKDYCVSKKIYQDFDIDIFKRLILTSKCGVYISGKTNQECIVVGIHLERWTHNLVSTTQHI